MNNDATWKIALHLFSVRYRLLFSSVIRFHHLCSLVSLNQTLSWFTPAHQHIIASIWKSPFHYPQANVLFSVPLLFSHNHEQLHSLQALPPHMCLKDNLHEVRFKRFSPLSTALFSLQCNDCTLSLNYNFHWWQPSNLTLSALFSAKSNYNGYIKSSKFFFPSLFLS